MYRDYDVEWIEDAACVETDPDAFFPEKGKSAKKAKEICLGCAAVESCLEFALRNQLDHGTWGAKTDRERKDIRRRREHRAPLAGAA